MQADPIITRFVLTGLIILIIGLVMKKLNQPNVIGYILGGIILGPFVLGQINNSDLLVFIGNLGIIFLLFFVGMEINLSKLLSNWKIAIIGTLAQILLTLGLFLILGNWLSWSMQRSVLIAFIITLSSTAVVIKLLQSRKELNTKTGQNVLGILIVQDLAVIPMMMVLQMLSNQNTSYTTTIIQIIGAIITIGFMVWLIRKRKLMMPLKSLKGDKELQVFAALILCLGFATITSMFEISAALGAFIAGITISSIKQEEWVKESLHSFYVIFLAAFFVYVGIIMDLNIVLENLRDIMIIVGFVFIVNTLINSIILRSLGQDWKQSIYAGAILSQAGEFGFVLLALGLSSGIILNSDYQIVLAVISITLLLSPFWISLIKKILHINNLRN